jgi:general secretion pathway protein E
MDRLIREPHGIVLVTGPTGSGRPRRSTRRCQIDRGTLNVMTVEDPIEFALDGVAQTQVNPRIELNFARALRSILRQDPDIIMIGEIRDLETAQIAVQASLTGHLVLATLHTNDAVSAVTRLADMGVEPYLLASSVLGVPRGDWCGVTYPTAARPCSPPLAGPRSAGSAQLRSRCTGRLAVPPADKPGIADGPASTAHRRETRHSARSRRVGEPTREACARAGVRPLIVDGGRWLRDGTTRSPRLLRAAPA